MKKLSSVVLALALALLASGFSPWVDLRPWALLALALLCLLAWVPRRSAGGGVREAAARADRHALAVIAENAGMMSSFTRAGEQGRGFAVVADEVRQLAVRTGEATRQIQQTISDITASAASANENLKTVLAGVHESVQRTRATGEALADIRERSSRTLQAAGDMASAAQTQDAVSERLMQGAEQLQASAGQSLGWVSKSNAQLRVVQGLIGELKHETSALLAKHRDVDVLTDCVEEMRACNILVMNSGSAAELAPVVKRIAQLDERLDAAWQHWQAAHASKAQAASAAFAAAVQHYRQVRGEALALAQAGRFDEVRRKIPTDVRQAYDGAKQTLAQVDAQDKALQAAGLIRRAVPRLLAS